MNLLFFDHIEIHNTQLLVKRTFTEIYVESLWMATRAREVFGIYGSFRRIGDGLRTAIIGCSP
jgi:hypothetical protein